SQEIVKEKNEKMGLVRLWFVYFRGVYVYMGSNNMVRYFGNVLKILKEKKFDR
ncbi:hypothetical protein LCGC14_2412490, partial [marine sediment metagenome]